MVNIIIVFIFWSCTIYYIFCIFDMRCVCENLQKYAYQKKKKLQKYMILHWWQDGIYVCLFKDAAMPDPTWGVFSVDFSIVLSLLIKNDKYPKYLNRKWYVSKAERLSLFKVIWSKALRCVLQHNISDMLHVHIWSLFYM